jgi:pimeloyl-ACP methyl ester carboxylesterase
MKTMAWPLQSGQRAEHLLVMLPGAQEEPEDFEKLGFVQHVRRRGLNVDILAVDSHIGYFDHYQIAERLQKDVIEPARLKGYRGIWLVGISLGGFGSVLHTLKHPQEVSGVILLAPYTGTRGITRSIIEAGGLESWRPEQGQGSEAADWEIPLWRHLRDLSRKERERAKEGRAPQLWLGYGAHDRFAASLELLRSSLPAVNTLVVQGGHDWPAWTALWQKFLQTHGHLLDQSKPPH